MKTWQPLHILEVEREREGIVISGQNPEKLTTEHKRKMRWKRKSPKPMSGHITETRREPDPPPQRYIMTDLERYQVHQYRACFCSVPEISRIMNIPETAIKCELYG